MGLIATEATNQTQASSPSLEQQSDTEKSGTNQSEASSSSLTTNSMQISTGSANGDSNVYSGRDDINIIINSSGYHQPAQQQQHDLISHYCEQQSDANQQTDRYLKPGNGFTGCTCCGQQQVCKSSASAIFSDQMLDGSGNCEAFNFEQLRRVGSPGHLIDDNQFAQDHHNQSPQQQQHRHQNHQLNHQSTSPPSIECANGGANIITASNEQTRYGEQESYQVSDSQRQQHQEAFQRQQQQFQHHRQASSQCNHLHQTHHQLGISGGQDGLIGNNAQLTYTYEEQEDAYAGATDGWSVGVEASSHLSHTEPVESMFVEQFRPNGDGGSQVNELQVGPQTYSQLGATQSPLKRGANCNDHLDSEISARDLNNNRHPQQQQQQQQHLPNHQHDDGSYQTLTPMSRFPIQDPFQNHQEQLFSGGQSSKHYMASPYSASVGPQQQQYSSPADVYYHQPTQAQHNHVGNSCLSNQLQANSALSSTIHHSLQRQSPISNQIPPQQRQALGGGADTFEQQMQTNCAQSSATASELQKLSTESGDQVYQNHHSHHISTNQTYLPLQDIDHPGCEQLLRRESYERDPFADCRDEQQQYEIKTSYTSLQQLRMNCDNYTNQVTTTTNEPSDGQNLGAGKGRSLRSRRGRPRKKGLRSKNKSNGKLWEFIRDLLLSDRTNPSFIRWERREDGVFKFVQSDKVAKMWGERKQNPKMTYEKLSRAMRYYYKSKVLLPVFGRRLVYKFGPNATGWLPNDSETVY